MATTSQVVTSSLPTAFEEFYKTGAAGVPGLIPQAFKLYGAGTPADYQANIKGPLEAAKLYTGAQRIQGLTPEQTQVGTELSKMVTPTQFASATSSLTGLPSITDKTTFDKYKAPYEGIIETQRRKAIEDAQKAQLLSRRQMGRMGQLGSSAEVLAATERERNLQNLLADIEGKGAADAWNAALNAMQAERGDLIKSGSALTTLGAAQQLADIDRLKTLGAYGDYERAVAQQQTDIDYANLLDRIQYPEQQLDKISSFIRGIPLSDRTQVTTAPPPSFASQLAGLGIAGLGAFMNK
jgi:hypothetical protein